MRKETIKTLQGDCSRMKRIMKLAVLIIQLKREMKGL